MENTINNASIVLNQRVGLIQEHEWPESAPSINLYMERWEQIEKAFEAQVDTDMEWKNTLRSQFQSIPEPLQILVSQIITAISKSNAWMKLGRSSLAETVSLEKLEEIFLKQEISPEEIKVLETIAQKADRQAIFRACAEISAVLSSFIHHDSNADSSIELAKTLSVPTPLGDLVLASSQDDRHIFEKPPFLLIDCGGNDTYSGYYAQSNHERAYSFLIDMDGEDIYQSDAQSFGSGCAVSGMAALIDLGPQPDRFLGKNRCFGYSLCGVSILYDRAGISMFQAESLCFGAADMGISILYDGEGNDTYHSLTQSQGYGAMGGLGLIYDEQGNDRYIASATPVVFPSAQLNSQNHSASQGFGTGRFGPAHDGRSLPGGIGILLDRQGDDIYQASVFAQGSGYGFGIGVLADIEGNDRYSAAWYAMGSSAHQGCGFFIDREGNDSYRTSHYMMAGAANDFSLSVFLDSEGNDTYQSKNASLGYSLNNSFSLFADSRGNDRYSLINQLGFGNGNNELPHTFRGLWPTYAFFVDGEGRDIYDESSQNKNGTQWVQKSPPEEMSFYFFGADISSMEKD